MLTAQLPAYSAIARLQRNCPTRYNAYSAIAHTPGHILQQIVRSTIGSNLLESRYGFTVVFRNNNIKIKQKS